MIKLLNVTKIYKIKKGPEVVALNRVNLVFGERGLVFVLGKSGAGKSTLLNIVGGLDTPSSGTLFIQSESSENFSSSKLDSYRNTYCGFIFQEYNLLPEFSIRENIALALELQGKKASSEDIQNVLAEVGLDGLGERKPDALSGGQKQRVAIARALIKKPEVLLADEPTGALDSGTGREIFSILRALAKNHLVIVVSHDREFAEYYGDRVIEIGDGVVKSDITKDDFGEEKKGKNLIESDEKTLFLKAPQSLSEEEKRLFHERLKKAPGPILLSYSTHLSSQFREQEKIDSGGYRDSFKNTDGKALEKETPAPLSLIKSKLPLWNALKVAFGGLKAKPFKLFLTFLLAAASFTMFALSDTMVSYNAETTLGDSLLAEKDKGLNYLSFDIRKKVPSGISGGQPQYYYCSAEWDDANLAILQKETGTSFEKVYFSFGDGYSSDSPLLLVNQSLYKPETLVNDGVFSLTNVTSGGALEVDQATVDGLGFKTIGHYPQAANEVAITLYQYEYFQKLGFHTIDQTTGEEVTLESKDIATPQAFLDKKPEFVAVDNSSYFSGSTDAPRTNHIRITGIIDTKLDEEYFRKDAAKRGDGYYASFYSTPIANRLHYGYDNLLFISDGFMANFNSDDAKADPQVGRVLTKLPTSEKAVRAIAHVPFSGDRAVNGDVYRYYPVDYVYNQVSSLGGLISGLKTTFFWFGFSFALFSCLLLALYIGNSISLEQRQIGILRAIGARGSDIYGIYSLESLLITLAVAFVSVFLTLGFTYYINSALREGAYVTANFIHFSFRQVGLLAGIAILLALAASFVPSLLISHKKPIDSINER